MANIGIADAKAHLSALVERAAAGETVNISRRGKPMARIVAAEPQRKPIDIAAIRAMIETMPAQAESAGALVRRMRDETCY